MKAPVITEMQVIPVAGFDSMLMTLSGAHAPCFTRNLVILKDSAGHTGIGEIHGGDYTHDGLVAMKPLVVGTPVSECRKVLQKIHRMINPHADEASEGIQTLDIAKLKYVVRSEWAIECAMLDLLGQYLEVPMAELLGEGKQRDEVEVLGYLFYVSDKGKVPAGDMQYIDESGSADRWFRLRREEILTPERIAEEAEAEGFTEIAEGTVYALLVRIEQKGLVDVAKRPSEKGPPRKVYSLNEQGKKELDEFWNTWSFLSDRLEQLRQGGN